MSYSVGNSLGHSKCAYSLLRKIHRKCAYLMQLRKRQSKLSSLKINSNSKNTIQKADTAGPVKEQYTGTHTHTLYLKTRVLKLEVYSTVFLNVIQLMG